MAIGRNDIIAARSIQNYAAISSARRPTMTAMRAQAEAMQRRDDEIQAQQDADNR